MDDKGHSEAGQDESEEHYIQQWRKTILGMKWQKRDSLAELWLAACCFVHGTYSHKIGYVTEEVSRECQRSYLVLPDN